MKKPDTSETSHSAAQVGATRTAPERVAEEGARVAYCVARPYSAGEHVEIREATISKVHDAKSGIVDLAVGKGKDAQIVHTVSYSEARGVGTWHWPSE